MKIKNISNIFGVVLTLLIVAGCGPSGSIPTSLETGIPSAFAVDVLCDGVECGDDVSADAVIGVKIKPMVDSSAFVATLSCDSIDYPLTLTGQEDVEEWRLFSFTHAAIPQVRPCTVTVSFQSVSSDIAKAYFGDGETEVNQGFTIACDPTGSDDFSYAATLEKCWKVALVSTSVVKQQGGQVWQAGGKGFTKLAVSSSAIAGNTWDDLEAIGATAEIKDGALQVTTATGTDLLQKFILIYKSFDGPEMPEVTATLLDDGFDLRPVTDLNNQLVYYANEMYAIVTADSASIADTCTFHMSVKGLPGNLQMQQGQMGAPALPPAYFGVNDWPGVKFISMQQSIQQAMMNNSSLTEGGCGFETTDNSETLMSKFNARTSAVKQSVVVECPYETASTWSAGGYGGVEAREYAYGAGIAMQDHVWQDKFGQYSTVGSDYFETANGTIVGFMYTSQFDLTQFPLVKGEEPPAAFVPFKLVVKEVEIEGAVVNNE